jgi:hypothetical protein
VPKTSIAIDSRQQAGTTKKKKKKGKELETAIRYGGTTFTIYGSSLCP